MTEWTVPLRQPACQPMLSSVNGMRFASAAAV